MNLGVVIIHDILKKEKDICMNRGGQVGKLGK